MALNGKDNSGYFSRHRWLVITLGAALAVILLASFASMRDEVIPIVDLRQRFFPRTTPSTEQPLVLIIDSNAGPIGLKVDEVGRIVTARPDELLPPPAIVRDVRGELLVAVIPRGEDVLLVIDVDAVLSDQERRELQTMNDER